MALLEVDQHVGDDVDDELQTPEGEGEVADGDGLEAGHAADGNCIKSRLPGKRIFS